jgi:ectoine hydroxylase-related dioxygenase (phytanoyl-CoA dioxygenase family)
MSVQQQTDFAMIPEADDLAKIDRRIGFHPTENDAPATLTGAQIDRWNCEGYLSPFDVLSSEEADDLRAYFDRLLSEALAAGRDSYSISSAHLKHARIYDLLAHPRLVSIVRDLLGPHVIGWGTHFFCKLPGDGKSVDWHQDCSYWPLTPTKAVTVWLAIDDADEENGCMEVVAGSHRFGLIEYESSGGDSQNVLNQTVRDPERYGTRARTPVKAGQMSIHSDLLLHGSPPNVSSRRRCGLTLRYCPADVVAHLGWNQKGRVVCGEADPQLWPGAVRPETD